MTTGLVEGNTEVQLTKKQRLRRALYWVVMSAIIANWVSYQTGGLEALWLGENHWPLTIYLGLTFVPAVVIYMVRRKTVSSPVMTVAITSKETDTDLDMRSEAGQTFLVEHPYRVPIEKANTADDVTSNEWFLNAPPISVSQIGSKELHEKSELSLWVRYPLALLCFWIAFLLFANVEDIRNALRIPAALTFVCVGFYLPREVMLWVAGLALVGLTMWGLIAGFAALTVPAAIVVGSLIIAFAISR